MPTHRPPNDGRTPLQRAMLARLRRQDLAREAGVSLTSVGRALGGGLAASSSTRQRVDAALQRLTVADGGNNPLQAPGLWHRWLVFLLPEGGNAFVDALRHEVQQLAPWLARQRVQVELRSVDAFSPAAATAAVKGLQGQCDAAVLMLQDLPSVREAADQLAAGGVGVVSLVSRLAMRSPAPFVGIDNLAAGRAAAQLLAQALGPRTGPVGIVPGSLALHDHAQRLQGFRQALAEQHPQLRLLEPIEGRDSNERSRRAVEALLAAHPDLSGVYSTGAGNPGILAALQPLPASRRPAWVCHELSPTTRQALAAGVASAVISQPAARVVQAACQMALARLEHLPLPSTRPLPLRVDWRRALR